MLHPVLFLRVHPPEAASPTALGLVGADRQALHVSLVGDRDDHVLFDDQVFDVERTDGPDDLGAPLVAVLRDDPFQLFPEDREAPLLRPQDREQLFDGRADLGQLRLELVGLEAGEAREPHVEDRFRLAFGQ